MAGSTIITKVVRHLLGDAAEAVERDVARDAARTVARDAGRDAAEAGARDVAEDAGERAARQGARDAVEAGERDTTKTIADRTATNDPIDVASGEVLLHQVDVDLPGVLPLELTRTHVSSFRTGRWFGPSWASTLDQRLEVDELGACLVGTEGLVLLYPIPMFGVPAFPERGPRWPLSFGDHGYTVTIPEQGRTLHFAPQPNATIPGGRAMVLPLAAISDRNGNRIELGYDGDGVLTEVRHSGGYRIGVATTDDRITELRLLNAAGEPVLKQYGYDGAGRLREVTNSSGRPTRFEYDAAGRMTRWTDTNGHWYAYTYDERGRGIAGTGSGGFLNSSLSYQPRRTVLTDSLGHETTYHLDEQGKVAAEVDPLGNTTWYEWDPNGLLLTRTDPLDRTTRHAYDESGNLVSITRSDGTQVAAAYNDLNLPVEITEADGAVWRQAYDERGNLIAVADPAGATTGFAYDDRGHLTAVTDPLGAVTRIETDATGLPSAVTDPLGHPTRYARDAFGRLSQITDPLGGIARFGWTIEGRPAWRVTPGGATERWNYDGEGNLTEYVDAAGHVTRIELTHFDLKSAETAPDGARLEFSYDTELRLTAVTNARGLVWRYEYDSVGNLIREIDFNGRTLMYSYDAAGQLIERTNGAGEVIGYAHDSLGNVIEERSLGDVATFTYDAVGRMVRAVNRDSEVRFERDMLGRITAETCNGRTLYSAYDAIGHRVRRRTPSDAESEWSYDHAGRPIVLSAGGQMMRFGYDPAGREIQRYIGSQVAQTQAWDADGRLTASGLWKASPAEPGSPLTAHQARLIQQQAYTYRADGYITGIHDQATGSRHYNLDTVGRVTAVHSDHGNEQYTYDGTGNVIHANWATPQHPTPDFDAIGPREYDGMVIRRAGGVRYEHDRDGRVVLRQHKRLSGKPLTWRFTWSANDRLTDVVTPDGARWRYRYDALGRRIVKQRLGRDTDFVVEQVDFTWDGPVLVEQAHSIYRSPAQGADVRVTAWEYEPGGFRPISQIERTPLRDAPQQWIDQEFYAIVTDIVGTPSELVDSTGTLGWRRRATLWGSHLDVQGRVHCPLGFPGQYFDAESGLNYNYHRYYDPAAARYETNDPLGLQAGSNPQIYVQNPLSWLDPLGLTAYHSKYPDGTPVYEGQQPGKVKGPDPRAEGHPHTVLKWDEVNNRVYKARTYGEGGVPVKDIDFTHPTFPNGTLRPDHVAPEQHPWLPNPTGGTPRRGPGEPLELP